MLTRDQILAAAMPVLGELEVPEWGGTIRLRKVTLPELLAWSDARADPARVAAGEPAALFVRFAAADESGTPLFQQEDMAWLLAQPAALLQRIFDAALTHSGYGARALEAAAGN